MPRRARSAQRASYFHVINRSVRRLVLFTQPADYRAFLSILNLAMEQYPVRLIAYSVMPDHWLKRSVITLLAPCAAWWGAGHYLVWHINYCNVLDG